MSAITNKELTLDLLWQHTEVSNTGCWLWTGYRDKDGYGSTGVLHSKGLTHRVGYMALVGPIPDGLTLDHLCRIRACWNPEHLEPVTQRENTLRGTSVAAVNAKKTQCIHGHEFDEANTYRYTSKSGRPYRVCRACNRNAVNRYEARRRAVREDA